MSQNLCELRLILVRRRQEISLDVFLIVKVSAQSRLVTKPDYQHFLADKLLSLPIFSACLLNPLMTSFCNEELWAFVSNVFMATSTNDFMFCQTATSFATLIKILVTRTTLSCLNEVTRYYQPRRLIRAKSSRKSFKPAESATRYETDSRHCDGLSGVPSRKSDLCQAVRRYCGSRRIWANCWS